MSRTADDEDSAAGQGWSQARNQLFRMIMEGRSFSGRERNCFFLNTGDSRFATISALSGIDFPDDGRCLALTDWDHDGDQDIWISNRNAPRLRFLRNDAPSQHHFLALRLRGNGSTANRDAIGARVEVVVAPQATQLAAASRAESSAGPTRGLRLTQTLRAGEGFLSQSSKWLHFGLGAADQLQRVIVRWPDRTTETFENLEVDRRYVLTQGQSSAEPLAVSRGDTPLTVGPTPLPTPSRAARVVLVSRVPMPEITYSSSAGERQSQNFNAGVPTLVNLWASWCLPCVQELTEFTAHQRQLAEAPLQIVALCVDRLADEQGARAAVPANDASDLLRTMGSSFSWGHIDDAQMNLLQELHDQFFFLKRALPLPTSFLVDAEGRLAVIYKGPVSVNQLQADLELAGRDYQQTIRDAACLPGRSIQHSRVAAVARRSDLQTRYRIAAWLEELGRYDDAERNFRELLQLDPNWSLPNRHLAKLQLQARRLTSAQQFAARAIELDPKSAGAHNTMGLIVSEQGDVRRSIAHLQTAIELDPDYAEAQNNLGTILAGQGQLESAQRCFERAVEIDDRFAEAHTNLGSVYAAKNQLTKAIEQYQRAIQLRPNDADTHNNLGSMYARQGRFELAIGQYQEALKLQPGNRNARRNLELAQKLLAEQRRLKLPE